MRSISSFVSQCDSRSFYSPCRGCGLLQQTLLFLLRSRGVQRTSFLFLWLSFWQHASPQGLEASRNLVFQSLKWSSITSEWAFWLRSTLQCLWFLLWLSQLFPLPQRAFTILNFLLSFQFDLNVVEVFREGLRHVRHLLPSSLSAWSPGTDYLSTSELHLRSLLLQVCYRFVCICFWISGVEWSEIQSHSIAILESIFSFRINQQHRILSSRLI